MRDQAEIWRRICDGDRHEFEAFYHANAGRILRFLCKMTGNHQASEDITQDIFMELWKHPNGFDPTRGDLTGYVFGIARNRGADWWRRTAADQNLSQTGPTHDADPRIRAAAATGLGGIKSDAAVDALLAAFASEISGVSGAILRALGSSRSPRALDALRRSLMLPDVRYAAVDGLVAFGGPDAIEAIRSCADEPDMDFREHIVETLAEKLRQPIDPYWLVL